MRVACSNVLIDKLLNIFAGICNGSGSRRRRDTGRALSVRGKRGAEDLETELRSYGSLLQYR